MIKIFTGYDQDALCKEVNEWIYNRKVIEIEYSTIADSSGQCFYTVLVHSK